MSECTSFELDIQRAQKENEHQSNISSIFNADSSIHVSHNLHSTSNSLNESCISIVEVITLIKDIVDHAKLLVMNAAIEAMRTGERVRYCAVVAKVVRTLAKRTQEANFSLNNLGYFKDKLQSLMIGCDAIRGYTQQVSYDLCANLTKLGHILFKVNAYHAIFISKRIILKDRQHCRFGEWLVAKSNKLFGHTLSYLMIDTPHAKVHHNALAALACIQLGTCLHDINVVIDYFDDVETSSKEFFDISDTMIKEA